MPKTGFVLSGGGMRGVAHLAIFDVLKELGITPDIIAGTSAGAICGAFFAAGYNSAVSLEILRESKIFHFNNVVINKPGFLNINVLQSLIEKHFPTNTFESLPIPLTVTATDIVNAQLQYFSGGTLSKAIAASACIPVIFEPVAYNDTLYVDGGIMNNFPVEPLLGAADIIVGLHVNAIGKSGKKLYKHNILERSFHLAINNTVHQKVKYCHVFIEPPDMTRFSMFDQKQIDDIYKYTFDYVSGMKKDIAAAYNEALTQANA